LPRLLWTKTLGVDNLFHDVEAQKRFADDDLIAIAQGVTLSWRQSLAAVDERTVGRAEILEKILAVA
jgi:hypothetical protein